MPGKNLSRDEAAERSALLSVDHYDVHLDLTEGAKTFRSRTTVTFRAQEGSASFIDFIADSVGSIELNGESLDPATHVDGVRVTLPALAEQNTLTVDGHGLYMNTGEGLHRFVDPADGEVYLYTQFEVADCRRMFAVFEQPDLKARYTFHVTAPAHWQIVSNEPTPQPVPAEGAAHVDGGEIATWHFPTTKPMSCYITALVAGPYDVVRDEVSTRAGVIPLGVFCRRSLTQYLDADNVLDVTKRGFAFFEAEFDQPYPFTKYDQIFTPEYNAGAMENAGCVTFAETYVFRGKVPESLVERRALTILHELAHMWFGDLVTMRWWDDLWLNESFAEWASTTCQAEATQWESAWTTFAIASKAWAYDQDQRSSTHPVAADMATLEDVEVNFDGITYAKGASVLKQLVAYVGREPFVAGLREYFRKHAWGNTELRDLLVELEAASGRDLGDWSGLWLETAGVATLRPVIDVDDADVVTSARITQEAPASHPTLRPHRLAVGAYEVQGDALVRTDRWELDIDGPSTDLPELVGRPRPALLLVNDDDLAYAKIRLDDVSLRTALANPRGFTESLPRALVLGAAWDMTRDAEMPARDLVELLLAALPGETNSTMLNMLVIQLGMAAKRFTTPAERQATCDRVAAGLRELVEAAEPGSDAQLQLMSGFLSLARSESDLAWVRALLDGDAALEGLAVDQDMRWELLTALAAGGAADESLIAAEHGRDRTATGNERAMQARAAVPTAEAKAWAWSTAVEGDEQTNSVVLEMARGFRAVHDPALLAPYVERYHAMLLDLWESRTHAVAENIALGFYPSSAPTPALLEATNAWLEVHADAPAALRRMVAENRDGVARALAAQARDAQRV